MQCSVEGCENEVPGTGVIIRQIERDGQYHTIRIKGCNSGLDAESEACGLMCASCLMPDVAQVRAGILKERGYDE